MKKSNADRAYDLIAKITESIEAEVMTTTLPERYQLAVLSLVGESLVGTWNAVMTDDGWNDNHLYCD